MKEIIIITALLLLFNLSNAQSNNNAPATTAIANTNDTTHNLTEFTDPRDNQVYKIIKIGNQTWMAENLNFKTKQYSYCYARKTSNCDKYGKLYRWQAANTACPQGWHLPTDEEWKKLEKELGMSEADLNKSNTWRGSNQGELLMKDTSLGFNAKLGGYFNPPSNYFLKDIQAFYWTATEKGGLAWYRQFYKPSKQIFRNIRAKSWGMSVRCVKDN